MIYFCLLKLLGQLIQTEATSCQDLRSQCLDKTKAIVKCTKCSRTDKVYDSLGRVITYCIKYSLDSRCVSDELTSCMKGSNC